MRVTMSADGSELLSEAARPPEALQSSISPLSMPTAIIPALRARSRPVQDNAVTLSRN
jgi:hypothetical protein